MSGTTTSSKRTQAPGSDMNDLLIQFNKAVADVDALRAYALNRVLGNPGLALSSNFDVKNGNAVSFMINGVFGSLAANTNCDTGTTVTIATTKWNAFLITVATPTSPALTATWATAAATYASEALAIAALAAVTVPASSAIVGYVTVQAAGATWTAGTDALASGTGGTPATTTNYYNDVNASNLGLATVTTAKVGNSSAVAITE
jgi:hypothetical protein